MYDSYNAFLNLCKRVFNSVPYIKAICANNDDHDAWYITFDESSIETKDSSSISYNFWMMLLLYGFLLLIAMFIIHIQMGISIQTSPGNILGTMQRMSMTTTLNQLLITVSNLLILSQMYSCLDTLLLIWRKVFGLLAQEVNLRSSLLNIFD